MNCLPRRVQICHKYLKMIIVFIISFLFSSCSYETVKLSEDFPDEKLPAVETSGMGVKGSLSISTVESVHLEAAIEGFKKKYPDIDIIVDEYDPSVEGSIEDFMVKLQTQFLANQGSDILSGFNVDGFAERGFLIDLLTFIENDPVFSMDDYYENIFDAFKSDAHQYILPAFIESQVIGLNLTGYSGNLPVNSKKTWNYFEITELSKKVYDESYEYGKIYLAGDNILFFNMFQFSPGEYINAEKKEVYFDTQKFRDLLMYCKGLSDKGYVGKAGSGEAEGEIVMAHGSMLSNPYMAVDKATGKPLMSYPRPLANEKGEIAITKYLGVSINNNSSNKDLAWLFVKYLLSDEFKSSPIAITGYMPIKKSVIPLAVRERVKFESQWTSDSGNIKYLRDEDTINRHIQFIENTLKMPFERMKIKYAYIEEVFLETDNFFRGKATVDEVAVNLQQKLSKMLGE